MLCREDHSQRLIHPWRCGRHLRAPANPGNAAESAATLAPCDHFQEEATAVLAIPPDSITGTSSVHHAHASAMAQYHACLAGHTEHGMIQIRVP
jgi:hypothetical protein